jgi:hypothetical protein
MLNAADWKGVFVVYARHPDEALDLARQLIEIRKALKRGRKGMEEAIAGIDLALEELYPHSSFDKVGRKMYQRVIEGTITSKQETKLRELGVKIWSALYVAFFLKRL